MLLWKIVSEGGVKAPNRFESWVLILVVVEDSLGAAAEFTHRSRISAVLILVVVEDSLGALDLRSGRSLAIPS